jgi:hypothetical protein
VNAAKVIEDRIERYHVGMVFKLLRESIRQSREAAHVHPHCQVLAFYK